MGFFNEEIVLSAEQQRKYDYFMEAMRMKGKNEYDAAFGLLQHCLDISLLLLPL